MKKAVCAFLLLLLVLPSVRLYADEYILGEGDLLKITVYEHPDLTIETRVSGEGKITVSLLGEVKIDGLTASAVEKKLTEMLADGYIVNPHISVFIEEYKSKKVTVIGEFNKSGPVELRGNSTLLEVISNAGGLTKDAGDVLYIQRKIIRKDRSAADKQEDITVMVDLKRLLEDGDITANVPVQDGDSLYVPRAAFVYVNGEVKTPGAYKITKGLTVLKAITLAGGFTQKAWESHTKILRKGDKGEAAIKANMDDVVMPDDIIMVPESIF